MKVWLALATSEHIHSGLARRWWDGENGVIAFSRFTQLGLLRLMTTAAAMDGKPLTLTAAWRVYDRFFEDDRVAFVSEPVGTEERFRELTKGKSAHRNCGRTLGCSRFHMPQAARLLRLTRRSARAAHFACLRNSSCDAS